MGRGSAAYLHAVAEAYLAECERELGDGRK